MTRLFTVIFTALTIGAASLTYYDVGMEETKVSTSKNVRNGSHGGIIAGGYRHGK